MIKTQITNDCIGHKMKYFIEVQKSTFARFCVWGSSDAFQDSTGFPLLITRYLSY